MIKANQFQQKKYLTKAKLYAPYAKNGVEVLQPEINKLLQKINKFGI